MNPGNWFFRATIGMALMPAVFAKGLTPEKAEHGPKARLGSLPFPGPTFRLVDGQDIGGHSYLSSRRSRSGGNQELSRGIFYTWRGGFLDLSHLRKSIDATAYFAHQIEAALREGRPGVELRLREPSVYRLTFRYPGYWKKLSPGTRERLVPGLALRLAQETSYAALSWHEMLTYHGYRAAIVVPEKQSAFSYDDVMSHIVGVHVAGKAISDPRREYDDAVTYWLRRELDSLEPAAPEETKAALRAVKGDWWRFLRCHRRSLDLGFDGNPVTPLLVNSPSFRARASPKTYHVPTLKTVGGYDFSRFAQLEIEPRILRERRLLRALPRGQGPVRVPGDLRLMLRAVAAERARP